MGMASGTARGRRRRTNEGSGSSHWTAEEPQEGHFERGLVSLSQGCFPGAGGMDGWSEDRRELGHRLAFGNPPSLPYIRE